MHVAKLLVVPHLQGVQAAWQPHHNDRHWHGRDLVTQAGAYLSAEELLRTRVDALSLDDLHRDAVAGDDRPRQPHLAERTHAEKPRRTHVDAVFGHERRRRGQLAGLGERGGGGAERRCGKAGFRAVRR